MVTERDGWLMIPYDGPEMALIEIGFDRHYTPAYLDWDDEGRRVAQAQATPERRAATQVVIRVNNELYSSAEGLPPKPGASRGSASVSRTTVT